MAISMISAHAANPALLQQTPDPRLPGSLRQAQVPGKESPELREAFDDFVNQSFFSQLLSQMRKTVGKPAYFHGGMGEELFQGRLDEVLVEKMSEASGETFSGPMFDLFMMPRP